MLSYCLGRYWAAPVTFKIESGYLSQERNFPCPCESAVAKAASVCVHGKICKFSHLQWNCILINWRSCSDFLIVLRFLKHTIWFLLFFFFPPRWYITACKGQYFACFGMSSEFVPQLENKMFIIGSFLGFFSWRLLLVKTLCSWSVSVLLWNVLDTLKSMKITCGLKDVCRKKPIWRSVPHADISGFILGFFLAVKDSFKK